jgi:hypothetical protein
MKCFSFLKFVETTEDLRNKKKAFQINEMPSIKQSIELIYNQSLRFRLNVVANNIYKVQSS